MKCELCSNEHDGLYGSGRFCSQKCARSFSSVEKREEINKKVSITLTGRKSPLKGRKGHSVSEEARKRIGLSLTKYFIKQRLEEIEKVKREGKVPTKKTMDTKILLFESGILKDECAICGWSEKRHNAKWSSCHLHHKDGDESNGTITNLEILCPNHHALTDTYCRVKNKKILGG